MNQTFQFTEAQESLKAGFLESLRVRSQSPGTLKSRGRAVQMFYVWQTVENREDVREVTRDDVRAYQVWLKNRGLTVSSQHVYLIGLRRFFEHLENSGVVLFNPCVGLLLPKLGDRLPRNVLTQAEARKVLDAPDTQTKKGIRDRAILELFYSTGIRGEEMAGLSVHDVDCKNGFLRVTCGKGAKDRVVPMGTAAAEYVAEYLKEVRLPWSQNQKDERRLWLSAIVPHQPMKNQAIAVMVRDYKLLAGVDRPGRTHLWRHSCATHLVQNGVNIAYVQRLLGHRSLETTAIYVRTSAAEIAETHSKTHPRAKVKA